MKLRTKKADPVPRDRLGLRDSLPSIAQKTQTDRDAPTSFGERSASVCIGLIVRAMATIEIVEAKQMSLEAAIADGQSNLRKIEKELDAHLMGTERRPLWQRSRGGCHR